MEDDIIECAILIQYIFQLVPQFVKIKPFFFRTKVQIKIIIHGNQQHATNVVNAALNL